MQTTYPEHTDHDRHNATTCSNLTDHLNRTNDSEFFISMGDDCIKVTVEDRIPYEPGCDIQARVRATFQSWLEAMPKGGGA